MHRRPDVICWEVATHPLRCLSKQSCNQQSCGSLSLQPAIPDQLETKALARAAQVKSFKEVACPLEPSGGPPLEKILEVFNTFS